MNSAAPRFVQVAAGGEHSLFLSEEGGVFVCGHSEHGRLGIEDSISNLKDVLVPRELAFRRSRSIFAGDYHSAIVSCEGALFTFGCGAVGQLGHGSSIDDVREPREVSYFAMMPIVKSAALGDGHSIVILDDLSVHAFGNNESGALGLVGPMTSGFSKHSERYGFGARGPSRATPSPITSLSHGTLSVATGTRHSLFLTNEGVFGCGDNRLFQLGVQSLQKSSIPRRLSIEGAVQVACGAQHSLILCHDGKVWGCGSNTSGELGFGSREQVSSLCQIPLDAPISFIAAGAAHSLFISREGNVYGCGWGACGSLGTGHFDDVWAPTVVFKCVDGATPVLASCGSHHSLLLLSDGTAWGAGCNGHGQLGTGVVEEKQVHWRRVETVMALPPTAKDTLIELSAQRQRNMVDSSPPTFCARSRPDAAVADSGGDSNFVCFERTQSCLSSSYAFCVGSLFLA